MLNLEMLCVDPGTTGDPLRIERRSLGGKPRLGSISKMGNRRLRTLLVVGAHAALYRMKSGKTRTPLADWARTLLSKKPFKLVAVALANKIARIAPKPPLLQAA
jgi:transposase